MDVKKEVGVGIFFLVFAAVYFIFSRSISTFDPFAAGRAGIQLTSRSLPQALSVLIGSLSAIHIVTNALKLRKEKAAAGEKQTVEKKPLQFKLYQPQRLMLITIALISAYIFLYARLGFVIVSALYLLAQMFLLIPAEKRKKLAVFTVCFSLVVPPVIYLVFTRAIGMFLPRGLLWWF